MNPSTPSFFFVSKTPDKPKKTAMGKGGCNCPSRCRWASASGSFEQLASPLSSFSRLQPQDSSDTLLSRALFSARVIDHLGTGSQSSVTLVELPCLDCDSGSEPLLAARKMLMAGNSREALLREATALRAAAAASPFVCRCLGWAQLPGGRLALLTEYADGGSLQDELVGMGIAAGCREAGGTFGRGELLCGVALQGNHGGPLRGLPGLRGVS